MVDIDYFAKRDKINNAECLFLSSCLLSCLNIFCGWVFSVDCYCSISSSFDQLGYSLKSYDFFMNCYYSISSCALFINLCCSVRNCVLY